MTTPVAAAPAAPATPAADATTPTGPSGQTVTPLREAAKAAPQDPNAKGAPVTRPGAPGKAAPPTEAPKPAAPEKKKFKLKVDGADVEEEYSDEQLQVELQMAKAARKRMQESAEIKKQFAQLKELAKTDPDAILKELAGIEDPDKWREDRIAEKWKREVMPEEQRKALDQQKELEGYKKQVEEFKAAKEKESSDKAQAALEADLETKFKRAFEVSGLPWEADHLEAFGKIALEALDYGVDLTPEQMAAEVRARLDKSDGAAVQKAKAKLLSARGEALLTELGDEVVKEVLRASVAKHRSAGNAATFATPAATKVQAADDQPKKYHTMAEWRRALK